MKKIAADRNYQLIKSAYPIEDGVGPNVPPASLLTRIEKLEKEVERLGVNADSQRQQLETGRLVSA